MIYEIINMSDKYTIEAHSLDVAFTACIFLGQGRYAFDPLEDGGIKIPLFMFGGSEEWARKHLASSVDEAVDGVVSKKSTELADCLDSCLIGELADRETYRAGLDLIDDPKKREQWRKKWHESRRSSMNDIGKRAHSMAAKTRQKAANPVERG